MPRVQPAKRNGAHRATSNSCLPSHSLAVSNGVPVPNSLPTTSETGSSSNSSIPGPIPRPPNPWILFRSDRVRKLTEEWAARHPESRPQQHVLSKLISIQWRGLSLEEREVWENKAKEKAAEHKLLYPDYVYRPKKRAPRQPTTKGEKKPEIAIVAPQPHTAAPSDLSLSGVGQAFVHNCPAMDPDFSSLDVTSGVGVMAKSMPNSMNPRCPVPGQTFDTEWDFTPQHFDFTNCKAPAQSYYPEFDLMGTTFGTAQDYYVPGGSGLYSSFGDLACDSYPFDSGYPSMQHGGSSYSPPFSLGSNQWY